VVAAGHVAMADDGRAGVRLPEAAYPVPVVIAATSPSLAAFEPEGLRWIAWNISGDADFAAAAHAAGAMSVLPSSTTPEELDAAVQAIA